MHLLSASSFLASVSISLLIITHINIDPSNHAGALEELDAFTDGTVLAQLEPLLDAQQACDVPPLALLYHVYLELMPSLAGLSPKPELRLLNAIAFGSNTILPKVGLLCCTLESTCSDQLGRNPAEGAQGSPLNHLNPLV